MILCWSHANVGDNFSNNLCNLEQNVFLKHTDFISDDKQVALQSLDRFLLLMCNYDHFRHKTKVVLASFLCICGICALIVFSFSISHMLFDS